MSNAPHDILDVQDQIKRLKTKRATLLAERADIKAEIEKYEISNKALKNELNVLKPLGELRFVREGDDSGTSSAAGCVGGPGDEYGRALDPVADKAFFDADRKMELQILNSEIRAALPGLEKMAVRMELSVHREERIAAGCTGKLSDIPAVFEMSVDELKDMIAEGVQARTRIMALMGIEVDSKRKEKRDLTAEIGSLRAKVEEVREMKSLQTRRAELYHYSLKNEMTKIDYLLKEQSNLEKLVDRYKYGM